VLAVEELLSYGNTGIGTFDGLDGEMIMLDGVVYQAKADGSVNLADLEGTTPFACVTPFEADLTLDNLSNISNIEELKSLLTAEITQKYQNPNLIYAAIITGNFAQVHLRRINPISL